MNVELLEVYGSDVTIAESAWVSSGRGDASDSTRVEKLIRMLAKEGHETPTEHVVTRWRITCPQRIQVQLLRHRMASHNVASARYGHKFEEVFPLSDVAFSEGIDGATGMALMELEEKAKECLERYNAILAAVKGSHDSKRVRELAAFALPQGVMSSQVLTINLRSLKNLLELRCSEHAQKEVQEVAVEMLRLLREREELKITMDAFFGEIV